MTMKQDETVGTVLGEVDTAAKVPLGGVVPPAGPVYTEWISWATCNGAAECGDNSRAYRTRTCTGDGCNEDLTQAADIGTYIALH